MRRVFVIRAVLAASSQCASVASRPRSHNRERGHLLVMVSPQHLARTLTSRIGFLSRFLVLAACVLVTACASVASDRPAAPAAGNCRCGVHPGSRSRRARCSALGCDTRIVCHHDEHRLPLLARIGLAQIRQLIVDVGHKTGAGARAHRARKRRERVQG